MDADDGLLARFEIADEPFNLVGKYIWRCHLHGVGQIDNDFFISAWIPLPNDGITDLCGKIKLGAHEALRRIFEAHIRSLEILVSVLLHKFRALDCQIAHLTSVHLEDNAPLELGCRVVEVYDRVLGSDKRATGRFDQMLARLCEDLNGNVVGDEILFDEMAHKIEFNCRGGRETHLDFLESHIQEQLEHFQLLFEIHGNDQRLIAVAKINAAPARRFRDRRIRPRSIL